LPGGLWLFEARKGCTLAGQVSLILLSTLGRYSHFLKRRHTHTSDLLLLHSLSNFVELLVGISAVDEQEQNDVASTFIFGVSIGCVAQSGFANFGAL